MAKREETPDDLDQLYQAPLGEFVKVRTALAKQAGSRAAAIKALQKPHVAAWAVNQLYWRQRKTYDRLIASAEHARQALTQSLGGRGSETAAADSAHEQAVNLAAAQAREILEKAGASTAPGTLRLVRDTLLALPGDERPGRLVRPLAPLGFGGLTSALQHAVHASRPPATVLKFSGSKTAGAKAEKDAAAKAAALRAHEKQAALEHKREVAKLDADLKQARASAERADAALAEARRAHTKAERRLQELKAALETASNEVDRTTAELRRLERAAKEAATSRDQLEFRRSAMD